MNLDQPQCKKQTLVETGSGAEEVERLIEDDQHQIDEARMISTRESQLQRTEENRLEVLGKFQQRLKERQESEEIKLREREQDRQKKHH